MIRLKKTLVKDNGSCNFCQRGTCRKDGTGLDYPYEYTWMMIGRSISARICDDCMKKMVKAYDAKREESI